MAIESYYFRKKIKYHLTTLEKYTQLTNIPDDNEYRQDEYFSAVEIKIIEICSLMRKMEDLGKLPDKTLAKSKVKAQVFKSLGPDSQRPFGDMEKEYDFNDSRTVNLTLRDVCNMVMHSYLLQSMGEENVAFKWLFVTSDYSQFKGLYMININEFIDTFRSVVDTYPNHLEAEYSIEKQRWIYKRSKRT